MNAPHVVDRRRKGFSVWQFLRRLMRQFFLRNPVIPKPANDNDGDEP